MKKALRTMLIIILIIVVLAAVAVGAVLYLKKHKAAAGHQKASVQVLSPKQAAALQFTLPQMTTNLNTSGIIQFTLTLQADSKSTKDELTLMQNQVSDMVNEIMRQYSTTQLSTDAGLNQLKKTIVKDVNHMLTSGKVTNAYLSQILVQ